MTEPAEGEEAKVAKQVTFQQPKPHKKRMKGVMNQLRNQMEFYFGDSNMSKDRFMKQKIDNTKDGYLPLSTFLNFNKVKEITDDQKLLAKSLRLSSLLEVNDDGSSVRRKTPVNILSQEEIDARTVYVEGFPKTLTHDWFHKKFSVCGNVTYVSLPRFKHTNDIKGFAFVEFETLAEASKAIETLNYFGNKKEKESLEAKVGGSIKQSKNLKHLTKRAAKEGIDISQLDTAKDETATEEGTEKEDGKESKKAKKKKRKKRRSSQTGLATSGVGTGGKESEGMEVEGKEGTGDGEKEVSSAGCTKKKRKRRKKRGASHSVESMEEGAAGDAAGDAAKPTSTLSHTAKLDGKGDMEAQQGQPTGKETDTDVPCVSDVSETVESSGKEDRVTKPDPDSESKAGKKRKRLPEESDTGPTMAKIIKQEEIKENPSLKIKKEEISAEESGNDSQNSEAVCNKKLTKLTDTNICKEKKRKNSSGEADDFSNKKQKAPKQTDQKSGSETAENTTDSERKRKRKSQYPQDDASQSKAIKTVTNSSDEEDDEEGGKEGSKTKRRRKKTNIQTLRLALRVMSKNDWSRLKGEYLKLQKKNMQKLKDQLREAARNRRKGTQGQATQGTQGMQAGADPQATGGGQPVPDLPDKKTNAGHPAPEFVPNAILEVKSDVGMCHQSIKEELPTGVEVAYIDVKPGMTMGHIRCKDGASAARLLGLDIEGCSLSLVEGVAEKAYWDKLMSERAARLSNTKRPTRRGKNKLLQRAQNPLGEIFMGQHLKFNDVEEREETSPGKME